MSFQRPYKPVRKCCQNIRNSFEPYRHPTLSNMVDSPPTSKKSKETKPRNIVQTDSDDSDISGRESVSINGLSSPVHDTENRKDINGTACLLVYIQTNKNDDN